MATIPVVGDEHLMRTLLQTILEEAGYHVPSTGRAKEGLPFYSIRLWISSSLIL